MRAAVQHQRNVGYVFAGSEPSLMERMLGPKRPFYKAGPVMRLDKIPADVFAGFINARFSRSGFKPDAGLGAAVVELAGNLPYDVQRLAHETWDEVRAGGRRRATLDDLHQALRRLLAEQHTIFEAVWQRLTLAQRAVLRAVVVEDGRNLLSADVRERHRLGGASTVQAALAALVRDDVVSREGDRYAVVNTPQGQGIVWLTVWDSPVEGGEFFHLAGQAVEARYSTKVASGSTELVKKYSGGGRTIQISTMEIQGRPVVIYADVPAGANPNIINPAQVTLSQ